MRKFNPNDIIFSPLTICGPVENGPAGLMADYTITGSWDGITKNMAFKVLHDVMNPHEPDPFMYDMALGMARKSLADIIRKESHQAERDELARQLSEGKDLSDGIRMSDITFSEPVSAKDHVYVVGEFLGQRLSAHSELAAFTAAAADGNTEKMVDDMKLSILHAFRTSYDRVYQG